MVFYGADVAALRALAASMDRSASTLTGSAGAVDGAVMRATAWRGPAADRFRAQWSSTDRRRLTDLASTLQEYARRLRANADAQDQASAAGTGALAPQSGATGSGFDAMSLLGRAGSALSQFDGAGYFEKAFDHVVLAAPGLAEVPGIIRGLSDGSVSFDTALKALKSTVHDTALIGGQDAAVSWHAVLDSMKSTAHDTGDKAMGVIDGAIAHATAAADGTAQALRHLRTAASVLGNVGTVVGTAGAVVSTADLVGKVANHTASVSDVLATGGTDLKAIPNPYAYVAGVALSAASTDVGLLEKTDFSAATTSNTFRYMAQNPLAFPEAMVGAVPQVLGDALGWL